ncbi:MAG: 4-alpha-glucanotransferase [Bacteroidales bacterium]
MKLKFELHYNTSYGEELYVLGSIPALGEEHPERALKMNYIKDGLWSLKVSVPKKFSSFNYTYLVKRDGKILRSCELSYSFEAIEGIDKYSFSDRWIDTPLNKPFFSSAFTESFFARKNKGEYKSDVWYDTNVLLTVSAPTIPPHCVLALMGEGEYFGNWDSLKSFRFDDTNYPVWSLKLDASKVYSGQIFKLAMLDSRSGEVCKWEDGDNRKLFFMDALAEKSCEVIHMEDFRDYSPDAKYAGTAIPVFSLRSDSGYGIGDFGDLYKFVDWIKLTGQSIIQILPINDTTMTHTWVDSYPYNANSIYALHPAYLDLNQLPALSDMQKQKKYQSLRLELNALDQVDYERATELKWSYVRDVFSESGSAELETMEFKKWFDENSEWLKSYAAFSYLRDFYKTPVFSQWKKYRIFKNNEIEELVSPTSDIYSEITLYYYIQYHLHLQLKRVNEYAHSQGVILKGDIPIGISRNSVEAWKEPYLFNMQSQAGAPPDDFSADGQNWGFPTYNWDEMKKTDFQWWKNRFRKMSDYFDAYRIDHLLGFFRIWEIPMDSVQGLLGHFNPALPYDRGELERFGFYLDDIRHLTPYIREHFLYDYFGEYTEDVKTHYLKEINYHEYILQVHCDTQRKIESLFEGQSDERSNRIRSGLYALCNEVLFVRDPKEREKFHPRISAQFSKSYQDLEFWLKDAFNRLYNEFFYNRHNEFWAAQAMEKLPPIIKSTNMLVCVEDLGMIPDCVPEVINQLQVLSLEIQRMPKDPQLKFALTNEYPYLSVSTTSTHDMSPVREWWIENAAMTQDYYNEILWQSGAAPQDCDESVAGLIIENHLNSPAMLTILPLQDWFATDSLVRFKDAAAERINIPSVPKHYWRYRMHISIENLLKESAFTDKIKSMIRNSGR